MAQNQTRKRGSKKKLVAVVFVVLLLLAAAAGAAWWFLFKPAGGPEAGLPWNPTTKDYQAAEKSFIKEQKQEVEQAASSEAKQQANVNLAEGYGFTGDYDKATAIYDTILSDPAASLRYDQYMVMGKFYALDNQMDKARQAFDKADQKADEETDPEERQAKHNDIDTYRQEFLQ